MYPRYKRIYEDADDFEFDMNADSDSGESLKDKLISVADNMGVRYIDNNDGNFRIIVSDDVNIRVRYTRDRMTRMYIEVLNDGKRDVRIDCTRNTKRADSISVDIQTAILIVKDIKNKVG